MADYYAGTSGLVLPVRNKQYYPDQFKEKSRLSYYSSLFNSIEVNSSFYKIPRAVTIAKWLVEVPEGFKFTFKLWRGITHEKDLIFSPADVAEFMQAVAAAGKHKGCLLVQFPPGARANLMPQLKQLITCIREYDSEHTWKVALEFRHASWYNNELADLVQNHRLSVVLQDIPASATPFKYATGNPIYLRFHGPGGKYKGSYTDDVLHEYAAYIKEWQDQEQTVYVYFNNTMGDAVKNLMRLNTLLA